MPGDKKKAVQQKYSAFIRDAANSEALKEKARLDYYNQRLDSTLYGQDLDKFKQMKQSVTGGMQRRAEFADNFIKTNKFERELFPDQMREILGEEEFADYAKIKPRYTVEKQVEGTQTTDPMIYGMRNSFANPQPGYIRTMTDPNRQPVADFQMDMAYDPTKGYTPTSKIAKEYEYGGYMMPQYGFGSWLKENGAGLLKGAGSLIKLIPGVGTIAGPLLDVAGSVVGGMQANKQAQAEADAQQKSIDQKKVADTKEQLMLDTATRSQNLFGGDKNINYGETFAMGGDLMMGQSPMQPQITEYSEKANLHSEGIGGVPVDVRGNPTKVSKTSAVGMTEGGEITWNSYVFSNKLKRNG